MRNLHHRSTVLGLLMVVLAVALCSSAVRADSASALARLEDESGCDLLAALTALPETSTLAVQSGVTAEWAITWPCDLIDDEGSEREAIQAIGEWVDRQDVDEANRYLDRVRAWLAAYAAFRTLERLMSPEGCATMIAMSDCMRASFPRGDDVLSALGDQVGETLASGEFPGVYYAAATQFAGLDPRAQLGCLARLFATAAGSSWVQE